MLTSTPDTQSATALGATWDTKLIETVGLKLLAPESRLRASSLLLAPTCNIQRVSVLLFANIWAYFIAIRTHWEEEYVLSINMDWTRYYSRILSEL